MNGCDIFGIIVLVVFFVFFIVFDWVFDYMDNKVDKTCKTCGGTGEIEYSNYPESRSFDIYPCPDCAEYPNETTVEISDKMKPILFDELTVGNYVVEFGGTKTLRIIRLEERHGRLVVANSKYPNGVKTHKYLCKIDINDCRNNEQEK